MTRACGVEKGSAVVQDKSRNGSDTCRGPEPNEGMNHGLLNLPESARKCAHVCAAGERRARSVLMVQEVQKVQDFE